MQPSEFPVGGYDPVDPPLFVSLPPLFVLILVVALMLAVVCGWYGRDAWRPRRPSGGEDLWKAVDRAARRALSAHADDLPARARDLKKTIESRLGPVLKLASDVAPGVKALDAALDGRIRGGDHKPHGSHEPHSAPPVTVVNNSHVVIRDGRPDPEPSKDKPEPHTHKPTERDMTEDERIDALRRAVGRFHDHWSRRAERIRDLDAARRALD